ncbi:MAG: dihydroorotate dehydrogenase electron transfer subunit [Bacillota bacterium]|nr:dihydroorotate dehydrogenase electron transfer subunit [Bacillota bacterium]
MEKSIFEIIENKKIAKDIYFCTLHGDTSHITAPGQFINIALDGKYLRRPLSVCDYDDKSVTVIYKIVGGGTEQMSKMKSGETLDVLTGLGNGFDVSMCGKSPLLIGGGVGIPPMYRLAKDIIRTGVIPAVVLGFNTAGDAFYIDEFKKLGAYVHVATVDGSIGTKGFVTDIVKNLEYTYFYTCGPLPMLKAVYNTTCTSGQLSFEERMGCGFGACMGCSCKTKYGNKRICKDGPVLQKEEIIW